MSFIPPEKPLPNDPPPKSGGKGIWLILLGCGGVMLVGVLVCGGVAVMGVRWGLRQVNEFAQVYEDQGYVRQTGQVIQVHQSPSEKTIYVCQVLQIDADVDTDIAAACQVAEVKANIHGNVDFFGQVLKVHPGAVIDGDVRVKGAQVVEVNGEVKGKITGSYGVLTYKNKTYHSGQSPTAEPSAPVESPQPIPAAPPAEAPSAPQPPEAPAPKEPAAT